MTAPTSAELASAFASLGAALRAVGRTFGEFIDTILAAVDLERRVRRAAIERHGITEADIRRIDGTTVITWNRRRIPIDLCTCYLGHPDDPTADEEACTTCDAAFWENPVFTIAGVDPEDDAPDAYDRARENDLEDMQGIWETDR